MDRDRELRTVFSRFSCPECAKLFDEDDVKVMRDENNYAVLKLNCVNCGKHLAIAVVGLDEDTKPPKDGEATSKETSPKFTYKEKLVKKEAPAPINYDDVLDAHKFFSGLDADWTKHLPAM